MRPHRASLRAVTRRPKRILRPDGLADENAPVQVLEPSEPDVIRKFQPIIGSFPRGWEMAPLDSASFHDCAFINAAVELCEPDHPAKKWVLHHKQRDRTCVETLAVRAGAVHAKTFARQLMLIMEGTIITALVQRDWDAARDAKHLAAVLVQREMRGHRAAF